jgi:dynactin-5
MTADKEGAIVLGRKCVIDADAMLRGDLARVQLGAHCFVGLRTVLRPPRRIAFAEDTTKPSAPRSAAGSLANAEVTGSSLLFNSPPASPPPPPPPARVCMWTKLVVGSHVVFGRDCVVEASSVGSFVRVGDGCVLGAGCIVKDCVWLMPGTLLPPGTIVAPFSIMSGAPAQRVGELPESAAEEFRLHAERTCRRRVYQKV